MSEKKCAIILTGAEAAGGHHAGALENVLFRTAAEWVYHAARGAGITSFAFTSEVPGISSDGAVSISKGADVDLAAFVRQSGDHLLLCCGETPLLRASTIERAYQLHVTHHYDLTAIKTERTATAAAWLRKDTLLGLLSSGRDLSPHALYKTPGVRCATCFPGDGTELIRIDDKLTLLDACTVARERTIRSYLKKGVEISDISGVSISPDAKIGSGTVILKGTVIKPGCIIGKNCVIGPDTVLDHAEIGDGARINASQAEHCVVGNGTTVGPYSHIRPDSVLGVNNKIGNFVEVKNSTLGDKVSVAHLTYIGDTDCGSRVNWGCGCVTVNYDGKSKFRCKVGDDVFVGCNTNLVAPVTVEDNSYIAAGSTITDTVPSHALAIARARQVIKSGWNTKREEKK